MNISIHVICRYISHGGWPVTTDEVIEKVRNPYQTTHDFVKSLGSEWFIFKYEDMIVKNFIDLHKYLGFEINDDAKIPATTKKTKVARKKAMGGLVHRGRRGTLQTRPVALYEIDRLRLQRLDP